MQYWLLKSEPDVYSIDDLERAFPKTEFWEGVRNYQARNFIQTMKQGDLGFFYHSNCKIPGIVGIMEIASPPKPDYFAFNIDSKYYDPKSTETQPRWYGVEVLFKAKFKNTISLNMLKQMPELEDLALVKKGNRLSVNPVTRGQWNSILSQAE